MTSLVNSFWQRPHTSIGRRAGWLAVAFVIMFIVNSMVFMPLGQLPESAAWTHAVLPVYGISMVLCGLLAGVLAVLAVVRQHERSWLVWFALLPGAFILFMLLGEVLVPH